MKGADLSSEGNHHNIKQQGTEKIAKGNWRASNQGALIAQGRGATANEPPNSSRRSSENLCQTPRQTQPPRSFLLQHSLSF